MTKSRQHSQGPSFSLTSFLLPAHLSWSPTAQTVMKVWCKLQCWIIHYRDRKTHGSAMQGHTLDEIYIPLNWSKHGGISLPESLDEE